MGLKLNVGKAVFLSGGSKGESVCLPFLASRDAHVPWHMHSGSIFKASDSRCSYSVTLTFLTPSFAFKDLQLHWVHSDNLLMSNP